MTRFSFVFIALGLLACGGSDAPAPAAPAPAAAEPAAAEPAAATTEATPLDTCVAAFARQKECTDTFIPALVDLRIQHDVPAGIAAEASSGGRDAIIAKAMQEWETDSQDANVRTNCQGMIDSVPPEHLGPMLEQSKACIAMADCGEFVQCVLPQIEQHLTMGK
jgi:hypothetical protein